MKLNSSHLSKKYNVPVMGITQNQSFRLIGVTSARNL